MGKSTYFLYLNEEEMIQAGVLDIARCIDVEEELFFHTRFPSENERVPREIGEGIRLPLSQHQSLITHSFIHSVKIY